MMSYASVAARGNHKSKATAGVASQPKPGPNNGAQSTTIAKDSGRQSPIASDYLAIDDMSKSTQAAATNQPSAKANKKKQPRKNRYGEKMKKQSSPTAAPDSDHSSSSQTQTSPTSNAATISAPHESRIARPPSDAPTMKASMNWVSSESEVPDNATEVRIDESSQPSQPSISHEPSHPEAQSMPDSASSSEEWDMSRVLGNPGNPGIFTVPGTHTASDPTTESQTEEGPALDQPGTPPSTPAEDDSTMSEYLPLSEYLSSTANTADGTNDSTGKTSPASSASPSPDAHKTPSRPNRYGKTTRRKTKDIDTKNRCTLSNLKTQEPPQGQSWECNDGWKPLWATPPSWRPYKGDEPEDSTMHMTYNNFLEAQDSQFKRDYEQRDNEQWYAGHGPMIPFSVWREKIWVGYDDFGRDQWGYRLVNSDSKAYKYAGRLECHASVKCDIPSWEVPIALPHLRLDGPHADPEMKIPTVCLGQPVTDGSLNNACLSGESKVRDPVGCGAVIYPTLREIQEGWTCTWCSSHWEPTRFYKCAAPGCPGVLRAKPGSCITCTEPTDAMDGRCNTHNFCPGNWWRVKNDWNPIASALEEATPNRAKSRWLERLVDWERRENWEAHVVAQETRRDEEKQKLWEDAKLHDPKTQNYMRGLKDLKDARKEYAKRQKWDGVWEGVDVRRAGVLPRPVPERAWLWNDEEKKNTGGAWYKIQRFIPASESIDWATQIKSPQGGREAYPVWDFGLQ